MAEHEGRSHRLDAFPAAAVRFSRALDRNRERIAEEQGLSAGELRALFYIGEHVRATPKQLAAHMHVTTAAITFISRRLVDLDLLQRVDHPEDRRSIFLELTPRAHGVMDRIHDDFDEMIRASTDHLTARQLEEFTESLDSVATRIAAHTAQMSGQANAAPTGERRRPSADEVRSGRA